MPIKRMDPEQWRRTFSRAALIGPPNSWKTTALQTWPRPIHIVAFPGEHGVSSIPQQDGINAYVWEDDPNQKQSAVAVANEVERYTTEILAGKHGEIRTFAGDGFHKFYDVIYEAELMELKDAFPQMDEDKLGGRAFGEAHKRAYRYFRKVMSSSVPYAVLTMWSEREKDDPENQRSNTHIMPDLPGRMAQKVMGEFGVVLYSEPGTEMAPGKFTKGQWLTRRQGKVWGAGLKLPVEIAKRIPTRVDQDWQALERMVFGDNTQEDSK